MDRERKKLRSKAHTPAAVELSTDPDPKAQNALNSLAFTYQEIRSSLTDMRQLLLLLRRTPQVASAPDAPDLLVAEGAVRFYNVSFSYSSGTTAGERSLASCKV